MKFKYTSLYVTNEQYLLFARCLYLKSWSISQKPVTKEHE